MQPVLQSVRVEVAAMAYEGLGGRRLLELAFARASMEWGGDLAITSPTRWIADRDRGVRYLTGFVIPALTP